MKASVILLLLILSMNARGNDNPRMRNYISYSVSNDSWISLSGTTNINTFECFSDAGINGGTVLTDPAPEENRVTFSGAGLVKEIRSFDCQNPLINRDMYRSFGKGDDAGIDIKLVDAGIAEGDLISESGNFIANTYVTINGQTRRVEIGIDWQSNGGMEYFFGGTAELAMSDFGIKPPSPMMGLIKVDDTITVRFNLIVQPDAISRLE